MTANHDRFQQAMNQGHSAAWDQQWAQAATYYRQALEEFPNHPKALNSLGLALLELGQEEQALVCYYRVTKTSLDDPVPFEKVGQICERLGRKADMVKAYLRASDLYIKQGDFERAIAGWLRVARTEPSNMQARTRLAIVFERLGRKVDAVHEYLAVASLLQRNAETTQAQQAVAHALQILPESSEVRMAWETLRANEYLPLPPPPRSSVARALGQVSQPVSRSRPVNYAPASTGPADPVTEANRKAMVELAALLFEQSGELVSSDTTPRRGIGQIVSNASATASPQNPHTQAMLYLGQAIDLQVQGKDTQATASLQSAVEHGLDHPAVYYDLGVLLNQASQFDTAVQSLKKSVSSPDYAMASHLIQGQCLQRLNQPADAAAEYMEALCIADSQVADPDQAGELQQLYEPLTESVRQQTDDKVLNDLCASISGLLLQVDWRQKTEASRRNLPPQPAGTPPMPLAELLLSAGSSKVIEALAGVRSVAGMGYLHTALEDAYQALHYAPAYLPLHTQIGDLLLQGGRSQDALEKFTTIAQTYAARGEVGHAVTLYRRVLDLSPMDLVTRQRMIDMLVARNRREDAVREYMQLADIHYRMGDLDIARKTYMTALEVAQKNRVLQTWSVQILNKVGDIDLQRIDLRQALRIYEQIRALDPADEHVRTVLVSLNLRLDEEQAAISELDNYLTYLEGQGHSDQAIRFIEGLVQEQPQKPVLHRVLAELYRRNDQVKEAAAAYDKAGDLYMTQGNRTAAATMIEALLALNPPNAPDYRRLLLHLRSDSS